MEVEPKVLVSKPADQPGWATLDVTPSVEFSRGNWFDMTGELLVARTRQTDNLTTTEITPRVGVRFHILSNLANEIDKERRSARRYVLRNYARIEWRHLSYSDTTPDSSTGRFRDRIENLFPLNRARVTDDGAVYLTADAEWFWTQSDVQERFANKQRGRAGIGYRRNYAWRLETLYVWDRSRDSAAQGFARVDNVLDVKVRHVW